MNDDLNKVLAPYWHAAQKDSFAENKSNIVTFVVMCSIGLELGYWLGQQAGAVLCGTIALGLYILFGGNTNTVYADSSHASDDLLLKIGAINFRDLKSLDAFKEKLRLSGFVTLGEVATLFETERQERKRLRMLDQAGAKTLLG
jgi:hypothetical protein